MGRGKWNRLTEKGKTKLNDKIASLYMKLTDIEDDYEKIYDLEESINDNLKELFECNLECESCTELDRARCMHNFRKANIFYLQKLRSYEEMFTEFIDYMIEFLQTLHKSFLDEDDDVLDKEPFESDKKSETQLYS